MSAGPSGASAVRRERQRQQPSSLLFIRPRDVLWLRLR